MEKSKRNDLYGGTSGMKEVFSGPDATDEDYYMLPTIKGNIWFMPISKTILEKVLSMK